MLVLTLSIDIVMDTNTRQLFLTVFMFLISRKFHDSFGIDGTEVTGTPMEKKVAQGRGWEW